MRVHHRTDRVAGRPGPAEAVLAAAAAGCLLVGAWPELGAWTLLPLALIVAGLLGRRLVPAAAALAVLLAHLGVLLLGLPNESAAVLPAVVVAVYSVGRFASRTTGWVAVAAFAGVGWAFDGWSVATLVFGLVLMGLCWGFGRLVRRRASAAVEAEAAEALVRRLDPEAVAAQVVEQERARVRTDAVDVVRAAVADMTATADAAASTLDPAGIAQIQERATAAVGELRLLLGLLRRDEDEAEDDGHAGPRAGLRRFRPTRGRVVDVAVALTLAALALLVPEYPDRGLLGTACAVVVCLAVAARSWWPAPAVVAAAAAAGVYLAAEPALPPGLAEMAAGAFLVWSAVARGGRTAWVGAAALTGLSVLATLRVDPENAPMVLAIHALPAAAAAAWRASDRVAVRAGQEAARLRGEIDHEVSGAVHAERLRMARELHDVASHAVGVMLVQAGAAAALAGTRPDEARAALRVVESTGRQALTELRLLDRVVRGTGAAGSGAGASGAAPAHGPDAADRLAALVARIEESGVHVIAEIGVLPTDPEVSRTAHRVVQEALTNVVRHAPGSTVHLAVRTGAAAVDVRVVDDGGRGDAAAQTSRAAGGAGFGLVGLAERVRAHGGRIVAGPAPAGGFVVEARIPLRTDAPAPPAPQSHQEVTG